MLYKFLHLTTYYLSQRPILIPLLIESWILLIRRQYREQNYYKSATLYIETLNDAR